MPLPPAGTLILKLRSTAEHLGRTPTAADINRLGKEGLSFKLGDFIKVFGSYSAALKRASLKPNYRRVFDENEKESLLAALRRLSRKWRRRLSTDDVRAARRASLVPPVSHFEKAFGSIVNALAAAGVGVKTFWSDDEMIALLREVDMTLDRPMRQSDLEELYRQGRSPSPKVLAARFGGMEKARKAARIKQKYRFADGVTGIKQRYSKDELIEQLIALRTRLGREPAYDDIMAAPRRTCASAQTFQKAFGSLRAAYEAAGFKKKFSDFSRKEIVAAVRRLKRKLGHFPTIREIHQSNLAGECPSDECIRKHLGRLSDIKEWI